MCLAEVKVSPLRRGTFVKQPQKYPKRPCPCVRPSLRSGSLTPVPLRGHAVTGHPWPNTALPASMPVDPLRETSSRPPEGAADQDQKPDHKQITSRSKTLWRCCSCSDSLRCSHLSVHQVKPCTRLCKQLSPTDLKQRHPRRPHRGKTHRQPHGQPGPVRQQHKQRKTA